jgi:hypothetical protein
MSRARQSATVGAQGGPRGGAQVARLHLKQARRRAQCVNGHGGRQRRAIATCAHARRDRLLL